MLEQTAVVFAAFDQPNFFLFFLIYKPGMCSSKGLFLQLLLFSEPDVSFIFNFVDYDFYVQRASNMLTLDVIQFITARHAAHFHVFCCYISSKVVQHFYPYVSAGRIDLALELS